MPAQNSPSQLSAPKFIQFIFVYGVVYQIVGEKLLGMVFCNFIRIFVMHEYSNILYIIEYSFVIKSSTVQEINTSTSWIENLDLHHVIVFCLFVCLKSSVFPRNTFSCLVSFVIFHVSQKAAYI